MGWIDIKDKYPPEGLLVLVEMSGSSLDENGCMVVSDHSFELAAWVVPVGKTEGLWVFHGQEYNFPKVFAWMPLPKHFQPKEVFDQSEDMMEHPMFEDEPAWLYKGDCVYEQMTLEDFMEREASANGAEKNG